MTLKKKKKKKINFNSIIIFPLLKLKEKVINKIYFNLLK